MSSYLADSTSAGVSGVSFRWFGQIDAGDDAPEDARRLTSQPKRLALLAYLMLARPRGPQRRDVLLALLWPEVDATHGRNALSQALHQLRRAVGADAITGDGAEALLVAPGRITCDVVAFEGACVEARWADAVTLYAGPLLPGLHVGGVPEFERWLDDERSYYRDLAWRAATRLAQQREEAGDASGAADAARRASALMPEDERSLRHLMQLLADAGDRAGALRAFELFARRLRADLEVEPSADTLALAARLRAAPAVAPLPPSRNGALETDGAAVITAPESHAALEPSARAVAAASPAPVAPVRAWSRQPRLIGLAIALTILLAAFGSVMARPATRHPAAATWTPRAAVQSFGDPATATRINDDALVRRLLEAALDEVRFVDEPTNLAVAGRVQHQGAAVRVDAHVTAGRATYGIALTAPADSLLPLAARVADSVVRLVAPGRAQLSGEPWFNPHNTAALRAFLDGEAAFRAGSFQIAASRQQEAVDLDPAFTAAWHALAVSAEWSGSGPWITGSDSARAQTLRSPRALGSHGPIVEGAYAYFRSDAARAGDRFAVAVAEHPSSAEAWFWWGEVLHHYSAQRGRSARDARDAFEHVLRLDPERSEARLHLGRIAVSEARLADARELLNRYLQSQPDGERALEAKLLRAWADNDSVHVDSIGAFLSTVNWTVGNNAITNLYDRTRDPVTAMRLMEFLRAARPEIVPLDREQELHALLRANAGQHAAALATTDTLAGTAPRIALLFRAAIAVHSPVTTAAARRALRAQLRSSARPRDLMADGHGLAVSESVLRPFLAAMLADADADTVALLAARHDIATAPAADSALQRLALSVADLALALRRGGEAAHSAPLPDLDNLALGYLLMPMGYLPAYFSAQAEEQRGHLARALDLYESAAAMRGPPALALAGVARVAAQLGRTDEARTALGRLVLALRAADAPLRPARDAAQRDLAALGAR